MRDRNWNTIPGVTSEFELEETEDAFEARFAVRHTSHDTTSRWRGAIVGTPDGRIAFTMDGVGERDMLFNRVGFCVLQPWRECAGRPFRGETPDGPVNGVLPDLIAPQGFANGVYVPLFPSVSRLEVDYAAGPTAVFEFEGDLFETEDQRNWTDASFKTYCTPLALGFPRELKQGEAKRQTVTVYADGEPGGAGEAAALRGSRSATRPARACRRSGSASPRLRRPQRSSSCFARSRRRISAATSTSPTRRGPAALDAVLGLCGATGAALELALFLREGDDLAPLTRRARRRRRRARARRAGGRADDDAGGDDAAGARARGVRRARARRRAVRRRHRHVLLRAEPDEAAGRRDGRRLLVAERAGARVRRHLRPRDAGGAGRAGPHGARVRTAGSHSSSDP